MTPIIAEAFADVCQCSMLSLLQVCHVCSDISTKFYIIESDGPVLHNYLLLEYIYTQNSNAKGINYVRTSQRQNG